MKTLLLTFIVLSFTMLSAGFDPTTLNLGKIEEFKQYYAEKNVTQMVDDNGNTLLHKLAQDPARDSEELIALLDLGANISTQNLAGATPGYYAIGSSNTKFLQILLDRKLISASAGLLGALHQAQHTNTLPLIQFFLERGANVNARDVNGIPAFIWAANYVDIMNLLLKQPRVNVNTTDPEGHTPLMHATRRSLSENFMTLINDTRTNINQQDIRGRSALMYVVTNSYDEIGQLNLLRLINCTNIHINDRNDKGRTALDIAIRRNNVKAVELLLRHPEIDVTSKVWGIRYCIPWRLNPEEQRVGGNSKTKESIKRMIQKKRRTQLNANHIV